MCFFLSLSGLVMDLLSGNGGSDVNIWVLKPLQVQQTYGYSSNHHKDCT